MLFFIHSNRFQNYIFIHRCQNNFGKLNHAVKNQHKCCYCNCLAAGKSVSWGVKSQRLWVVCCLTSPNRRSAMFSSELLGRMSFLSTPPWIWRAWLTPAIATSRARRVTTAAASMVVVWTGGGQMKADEKSKRFQSSDSHLLTSAAPGEQRKDSSWSGLVVLCARCSWLTSVVVTSLLELIYTLCSQAGNPQESWRSMLLYKGEQDGGRTSP